MLKVGNKVRVIKDPSFDAGKVAGRVGRVVNVDSNGDALIFFPRFKEGHEGQKHDDNRNHWYVSRTDLRLVVKRNKKA